MLEGFLKEFGDRLYHRRDGFAFIMLKLSQLARPVFIVETGTARQEGNWSGDGQSTLIWDWVIRQIGGYAVSVDIDEEAVKIAHRQASRVYCKCDDSQQFLRTMPDAEKVDLLFLDAYDWGDSKQANTLSELHHVGELAAIYERLRPGCLIAVDDCHGIDRGKHVLVQEFFNRLGVEPKHRGYISVWQKP
jgi:SAM-dependent methyltransferase